MVVIMVVVMIGVGFVGDGSGIRLPADREAETRLSRCFMQVLRQLLVGDYEAGRLASGISLLGLSRQLELLGLSGIVTPGEGGQMRITLGVNPTQLRQGKINLDKVDFVTQR